MEMIRLTVFAATMFAIAYSTGAFAMRRQDKSEYISTTLGIITLAIFMATGAFLASFIPPAIAKAGCFLFLLIAAIRKLLEMKMSNKWLRGSFGDAVFYKTSDAAVAGFGAGLGGVSIPIAIGICVFLHIIIALSLRKTTSGHSRLPMPALGAILYISLAVLL